MSQICEEVLRNKKCGDSYLGMVAEIAVLDADRALFSRAVRKHNNAFDAISYHELGRSISLLELQVAEDEYVPRKHAAV